MRRRDAFPATGGASKIAETERENFERKRREGVFVTD